MEHPRGWRSALRRWAGAVVATACLVAAAPAHASSTPLFADALGGVFVDSCTTDCHVGTGGAAAGQLNFQFSVAVSGSGDVYVADMAADRVDEYTQAGVFVRAFGKNVNPAGGDVCTDSCRAGTAGGSAGQLNNPYGVAVSGSGDVYVADGSNNRVDEFTQAGAFVRAFGKGVDTAGGDVCTSSCQAGGVGAAAGQLNTPLSVAVAGSGDVYVADANNSRVDEFTQAGVFVRAFGKGVNPGIEICMATCQAGTPGSAAGQSAHRS